MNITKCDLSFDEAVLDYKALKAVAAIAVGRCVERIEEYKSNLHNGCFEKDPTKIMLSGRRLYEEAEKLAKTTEVYACLCGGETRDKITIINHRESEEEKE